jgi:hypothetical protein
MAGASAIGGSVADQLAQRALREALEKAAREAAQTAAREAAERAAREAAEAAAKKAARDAGEKAAREAAEAGASEAAQQAAKETAEKAVREATEGAVEQAVKEAGEIAAAKAIKKSVSEASEKAAKEAGEKAAREAAEAGASESAQKAARESAENASRNAAKKSNFAKYAQYAAAAGVSTYVYLEMMEEEAEVKACIVKCLPTNFDAYKYEGLDKSDLEYSLITPSDTQPVCNDETEAECDIHCQATCEELHETGLLDKLGPVGDLGEEVRDAATNIFTDGLDAGLEALGFPPLTGPDGLLARFGKAIKIGGIICLFLCLVYILFMVF